MTDPLANVPEHQRAVVAWIDLQIANLDAQRRRLVAARELLAGVEEPVSPRPQLPGVEPLRRGVDFLKPHTLPPTPAVTSPEPVEPLPDLRTVRKYITVADRMREFLVENGPATAKDMAAATGLSANTIDLTGYNNRDLFSRTGQRPKMKWALRPEPSLNGHEGES